MRAIWKQVVDEEPMGFDACISDRFTTARRVLGAAFVTAFLALLGLPVLYGGSLAVQVLLIFAIPAVIIHGTGLIAL